MRRIFGGFCINRFGVGPLHYISSRSDFGLGFAEIFVMEKRLPDLTSRWLSDSGSRGVADSPTRWVGKLSTCRVWESATPRVGESPTPSRGVVFRLGISPRIWSQNQNCSKGSVKDPENPPNPPRCHVPLSWEPCWSLCLVYFRLQNLSTTS
jgi:hypothetical protein